MKNIKLIINRSEITAGTRGASLGPDALKVAAWDKGSDFFAKYPVEEITDQNHFLNAPVKHAFAKRIEGLISIYKNLSTTISTSLNAGDFPIVLAGDHGSAGGTIAAIKQAYPSKRLGVVWVDAHGDLHTPYTTPSGNMHGMPLAVALGTDNLESKRNDIPQETKNLWEELKSIGGNEPKIKPEDLVFVAVRDVEEEEIALMNRLNIRNFAVDEVKEKSASVVAKEIFQLLDACDMIYISFDVDSMDPIETSHGTGTPVENGLFINDTTELLTHLVAHPKLVCFEMVEINPCLDEKKNKMADVAFQVLQAVMTTIEKQ